MSERNQRLFFAFPCFIVFQLTSCKHFFVPSLLFLLSVVLLLDFNSYIACRCTSSGKSRLPLALWSGSSNNETECLSLSSIQVAVYFASTNESGLTTQRRQAVGNYCPHLNGGAERLTQHGEGRQRCSRSSTPSSDCQHRLSKLTSPTLIITQGER